MASEDPIYQKIRLTPTETQLQSELAACLEFPETMTRYRRFFLLMLQSHFNHSDNQPFILPTLECLHYDRDENNRTLNVGLSHDFDPDNTETFPGVYIKQGRMTFAKHSLGNDNGESADKGEEDKGYLAKGLFEISHVAPDESIASDLAESTLIFLTAFAHPFARLLGLMGLEVNGMVPGNEIRPAPDKYHEYVVSLQLTWSWGVTLFYESHRIKKFSDTVEITC